MPAPKTHATEASVEAYIASRASAEQAVDCQTLLALLQRATGAPPRMWGPSIVGFGSYRYRLASGKLGESCATGFAIRGRELVVYLMADGPEHAALRERLGTHRMGKACVYVKRLADLDLAVLEQLVTRSVAALPAAE
jgi:hypothetical protein